jgi:PLP dependent protein
MNVAVDDITRNLERIRAEIGDRARQTGRHPEDVRLIAISKTLPTEAIAAAIDAGQLEFGENTVQEALAKQPAFQNRSIVWHFIGRLQSNKAKHIPGNFQWLHSLDSVKLATRLARQLQEKTETLNALIEINITRDPKKHGIASEELMPLVERLLKKELPGLNLRGLMAMGPYPAKETEMRAAFAAVRRLRDECIERFALPHFTELSMGMSGDYAEAIQEGATMVRIGTAIFGERNYST